MEVYLDNAASTKMRKEVVDFLYDNCNNIYANASAQHFLGRKSRVLLENARQKVASLLNVNRADIIFTSGATESNNLAIKGVMQRSNKKEIIISSIEHSSILNLNLDEYIVRYINVGSDGIIDTNHLKTLINENTQMVCVSYVNSETGCIQPIEKIRQIIGDKIHLHVDGVQILGRREIDLYKLRIDSFTASFHKIHGPKGVGLLYIKDSIILSKQIEGGHQERNKRAGTENINNILASVYALELMYENMQKDNEYLDKLMNRLTTYLQNNEKYIINGVNRSNNIINFQIRNADIQILMPILDMKGICISAGSACMSGALTGSEVLKIWD